MIKRTLIAILLVTLLLPACRNRQTDSTTAPEITSSPASLTPEELAELGAKIMREPQRTQELLAEKGLDQQQFEQALRRVAEDKEQSQRYAAAFKQQQL